MDATQPFVGRRAEVELLLGRLAAAADGRGGVVLVSGPAGIGKTRLVAESLARHRGTARIGRGVCSDDRGAPPLWPWVRAVSRVPDLADVLRPAGEVVVADPSAAAAERFRRLTAATDALLRAAADAPLVLVLEDLHWADAESLELLRRVAAEAGTAPLLVLATLRDAAPDEVVAAVADARRDPATAVLALAPLSAADVGDYLRAAGAPDEAGEASEVHRRTGGLPLLLSAVVSGMDGAVEGDLRLVVAGLLSRLTAPERTVVESLAVLGTSADRSVLAAVSEVDTAEVPAAIAAGGRAGLLGPDGGFAHALLRDAVRRTVDPAAAAARHRRAAEALGATGDPRLAGEVAAHWRAVPGPEAARHAVRSALLAAEEAGRTLALDDAVRHLADAAGSLDAAGVTDAERAELLVRLATAEFLAGRFVASLTSCEDAARAAERAGRPDLVAAAALVVRGVSNPLVSAVLERLCRPALAADQPPAVRARLLAQLATACAEVARPEEASALATEALAAAEADGDPAALLDAARAREMTLLVPADAAERLRLGRLTLELGERTGQLLAAVLGAGWQIRSGYELGRMDLVDDAYAALERLADRSGQPLARWHLLRAEAARAVQEGRFPYARRCSDEASALAAGFGDATAVGMSHALAVQAAVLRGDPAELLDGSLEMATMSMPLVRTQLASVLLLLGRRDEAYAVYEVLRAELPSIVRDFRWAPTMLGMAQLAAEFEDAATADALTDRLAPWRECLGAVGISTAYFAGSPLHELGRLALVAGRPDEAAALLRDAVARNLAVRARPHAALARLSLAEALRRQGSLDEAAGLARQAADELRRLEMPGPLHRADVLAAGISAARRETDPLSEREREVRDLVLAALSNREIAARLVLSERTVESHVRSILAKLGCANRAELIARHASGR